MFDNHIASRVLENEEEILGFILDGGISELANSFIEAREEEVADDCIFGINDGSS